MAIRNYVGARYVPKLADPVEWQANTSYEAMVIVTYNNSSYTSKVPVPPTVGNPAENSTYWALTGNYNAQVEEYRKATANVQEDINELKTKTGTNTNDINELKTKTETNANDINELKTKTGTNTNDINELKTKTGTNTNDINELKTKTGTNANDINELKTKTGTNTIDINELKTKTGTNTNDINELKTETGTNTHDVDTLGKRLDNLILSSGSDSSAEVRDARTGYDGTVYNTLGTAIRKQVSDINEDLDKILSPNLYNPTDAKENTAINQDNGTEMAFDVWNATGYIPVHKGDVLYFSSNNEPTTYSTGAFYDAQKKFTSGFGNPNNNNNITVTSNGYARFSFDYKREKLQIEKGSRTTFVPYGELKIKIDMDNVKEETDIAKAEVSEVKTEVSKIQEDHTNLFNKDTVVKGAIIPDSGNFDTSFTDWESSDYIPVKPGMTLYFSSNQLPIGVVSTGAYFDKDKKYVSGVNNEPTVLTVPDGAYYLRFSKNGGFGDALNTLKIERYGITKFTPYGELYVAVNESALPNSILPKWKGLKILTLGDSITAMGGVNGWTYWIKQYLLADKVVNVSVAGSTWQDKVANQTYDGNPQPSTDGNVMGNQVQKVLNAKANGDADYQDFDVITFSFGTNDSVDFSVQTKESVESQFITNYAQNNFTVVPLESVNRQTLAGAMRYGFQKLHEAYPNAVIFMCTPTQECYETFDSIYQKGDLINFVADRLGTETIDTRRCGIRNIYESQTTIDYDHPEQSGTAPIQTDLLDGLHTNESGAKKIAKYNAREIMKYFMIN